MNYIFVFLILISIITAIYTGKIEEVTNELLNATQRAVQVSIGLIGIMAFWLGIAKIAQKSGLINLISKLISPILKLVFNELPKNSPAFSNIALNITANALGLSNAATPFGIKAMKDIKKEENKNDVATNSMCIFLAMNTAGFQIVPATVLAILIAAGAKNPTEIILPTFIVTLSSFIFAIVIAKILAKIWREN